METVAIIAEFNPFHNGHALLFDRLDGLVGPDGAKVVVMSGCFTQRGEPALLDKWTRARTALLSGADLVVELPFAYAAASAGRFAAGGVALAEATGVCRHLAFGSETADLGVLEATAALLADEPARYRELLRGRLDLGESYAGARIAALEDYLREEPGAPGAPDAACLKTSNNILAVEYLSAIQRQKSGLRPWVVLREGAAYRDGDIGAANASATAIRTAVREFRGDPARMAGAVRSQMPAPSLALLSAAMLAGEAPVFPGDLAAPVVGMLRSLSPAVLESFAGMDEGLSARLAESASRLAVSSRQRTVRDGAPAYDLMDELLAAAATRRYAPARIQRALTAMLAGLTKADLALFGQAGEGPRYLRILGFSRKGRRLLQIMRKRARLPVIMNASDFLEHGGDPVLTRMAELDITATDLWMLARGIACGRDFDTPPVMV